MTMKFGSSPEEKIYSRQKLLDVVREWKALRKKVVFTNGSFDILHPGHVDYLFRARNLGDVLVVGINSDRSSRALCKGPSRPLQDENARARVMAGLASVDAVTIFDEDTPYELIRLLEPDVLVKGGEYRVDQIMGHDLVLARGGVVTPLPMVPGYSTTAIEEKIISAHAALRKSSSSDSLVQIVNENDEIIGHKKRGALDYTKDIYRVSVLWLENSKGEVLIAQRSYSKDKHPGKWGHAVTGTLEKGETYDSNIYKEAEEEIGLTGVAFIAGQKSLSDFPRRAFWQLFTACLDRDVSDFKIQEEEVEQIRWISKPELAMDMRMHPKKYTPALTEQVQYLCK